MINHHHRLKQTVGNKFEDELFSLMNLVVRVS